MHAAHPEQEEKRVEPLMEKILCNMQADMENRDIMVETSFPESWNGYQLGMDSVDVN